MARGELFDAGDAVEVADVVLRHRARPAGDVGEQRLAGDLKQVGQFVDGKAAEFGVGQVEQLGLQRAADEDADQHGVGRRAAGEFLAGETGGDDAAAFDLRHDEAEAVERVADLAALEAEADDGAAGVFDGGQLGGEFGVVAFEQLGGGVGGDGEDEGVEGDCGLRRLRIGRSVGRSKSSCQRLSVVC